MVVSVDESVPSMALASAQIVRDRFMASFLTPVRAGAVIGREPISSEFTIATSVEVVKEAFA